MARLSLAAAALSALLALTPQAPVRAETAVPAEVAPDRLAALSETLLMQEVFAVMAEEGRVYGASIEEQMFPGRGGAAWAARVQAIYDPVALMPVFTRAFEA